MRQAIKLRSNDASYWNELCVLLSSVVLLPDNQPGRSPAPQLYNEAQEAIIKALQLDPNNEQYQRNRSEIEARLKRLTAEL